MNENLPLLKCQYLENVVLKKVLFRGKYDKSTETVRRRVIVAADAGDDWATIASANGVKSQTASSWVCKGTAVSKSRGGSVT